MWSKLPGGCKISKTMSPTTLKSSSGDKCQHISLRISAALGRMLDKTHSASAHRRRSRRWQAVPLSTTPSKQITPGMHDFDVENSSLIAILPHTQGYNPANSSMRSLTRAVCCLRSVLSFLMGVAMLTLPSNLCVCLCITQLMRARERSRALRCGWGAEMPPPGASPHVAPPSPAS